MLLMSPSGENFGDDVYVNNINLLLGLVVFQNVKYIQSCERSLSVSREGDFYWFFLIPREHTAPSVRTIYGHKTVLDDRITT